MSKLTAGKNTKQWLFSFNEYERLAVTVVFFDENGEEELRNEVHFPGSEVFDSYSLVDFVEDTDGLIVNSYTLDGYEGNFVGTFPLKGHKFPDSWGNTFITDEESGEVTLSLVTPTSVRIELN